MARWDGRVDDLLYEGESVRERVRVGTATVVVTSHRVLAFTPERDGANVRHVERPNVAGVETGTAGDSALLMQAARAGIVGAVLVGAGLVVDFERMLGGLDLGDSGAGRLGIGGVLRSLQQLLAVLRDLDRFMQLFGALALLVGVALAGAYLWQRDRTLVLRVAGGEDVHLPRPDDAADAAARLERAIGPGDGDSGPGGDSGDDPLADPPGEA